MYSELPASTAARSARLRSTKERRSSRVTPLQTTFPPKAAASARAAIVSATKSWAKCGMTARAVGPTSAPSGSTGTSRQPRTVRPSSSASLATSSYRAARSFSSAGRKAMPTEYSPIGGRSKSTPARSRASGTWVRMPAPSPELGSDPAAPRWSRLCSAVRPAATIAPGAAAAGVGHEGDAAGVLVVRRVVEAGRRAARPRRARRSVPDVAAAGAGRSDMSLPSSAAVRTSGEVPDGGAGPGRWSEGGGGERRSTCGGPAGGA